VGALLTAIMKLYADAVTVMVASGAITAQYAELLVQVMVSAIGR
jgi:hypothetical protein